MDKKVRYILIVLCVAVALICTTLLFIMAGKDEAETTPAAQETQNPEQTALTDPTGSDGYKVHTSENGYTVKYPEGYTATQIARAVDFILTDDKSGSSINIVTAKNEGTLKKVSKEEFESAIKNSGMGVEFTRFEETTKDGAEVLIAEYTYDGNEVVQHIIIAEKYGYNITLMKGPQISQKTEQDFLKVMDSFSLN